MRDMTLTGRIVNDAQLKQTKNGRNYIEFRFANNEYGDPENSTYWFRVASFQPNCINLQQWLTKGKPLLIVGRYSDRLYTTQAGVTEIGREINAHTFEFISSGEKQEKGTAQAAPKAEEATSGPVIPPVTAKAAPAPAAPKAAAPSAAPEEDDDLPF